MNWTKASAIAEILSSVAILITLLYLVIEIGQNTAALEADSRQAIRQASADSLSQVIDDPNLWLNLSNPEMTDAEKVQLSAYLIAFSRAREVDWLQYQAGVLDETTWSTYQGGLIDTLSYSESRKWWEFFIARSEFESNFQEHVSELLQEMPIKTRLSDLQAFD